MPLLPNGKVGINGEQQRSYQPQNQDHLFRSRSPALPGFPRGPRGAVPKPECVRAGVAVAIGTQCGAEIEAAGCNLFSVHPTRRSLATVMVGGL